MNTSFERSANRSDEWYTPKWIIDSLPLFDLDPCAPRRDFYTAQNCYTKEDDGLSRQWFGNVWCNPPYRKPLLNRFIGQLAEHNNGIALIFNRMDTAIWHSVIFPTATAMRILRGRIRFIDAYGKERDGAGCGSILVAWGKSNAEALQNCPIDGKFIYLTNPTNHEHP